jgi:serine/threonine protein phosphatase 1
VNAKIFYAIGDVHGRLAMLERLLANIEEHAGAVEGDKTLVYVGDYVDRGPHSADVVARVRAGPPRGIDSQICLRGNHEQLMIDYAEAKPGSDYWLENDLGGAATLKSYGGDGRRFLVDVAWMESLPLYHRAGDYLFVHAGIVPGRTLEEQKPQDMIWIRDAFLNDMSDHGFIVVHGHTPTRDDIPDVKRNRINVDTGAAWGGPLTCAVLDGTINLEPGFLQAFPE